MTGEAFGRNFCLACEAEARHTCCFSGVVVVGVLLSSLLVQLCFSGTIRARVMKLGTSIYLVEGR